MQIRREDRKKSLSSRTRHYVNFQSKTEVGDGEGGYTENWANITNGTNIPAEILPIRADRQAEMRSYNIEATHYIKARSNIPIEEVGRIEFPTPGGNRYFFIHTLEDIQTRDIEQFMICEERRP